MARIAFFATLLAVLLSPAAQAAGPAATARALDREMQRAGAYSGAYVVDLDTGQELYARSPDVARIPASVNKLYTTAAAIRAYGRLGQLTTEVLGDAAPDDNGRRGRQPLPARQRRPELRPHARPPALLACWSGAGSRA